MENLFTQYVHLSGLLCGEVNDTHLLYFIVGGLGSNQYILNHYKSMKTVDTERFDKSMAE